MKDCIFCKIINKEMPSYKIYEDEFTYAFLDISNDGNGHILVIPKNHFENILDCSKDALCHLMETVQKISKHLVSDCGFDGVNIINASGQAAEQSVFHFHIHILPRAKEDNLKIFPSLAQNKESLEELCNKLRMNK